MTPEAPSPVTEGFGHGKVILLGEHTVVAGHPALAVGLRAGVRARIRPGTGCIDAPSWDLKAQVNDGSAISAAFVRLCDTLGIAEAAGLDVDLQTEIPSRAGLGSSAAVAVAIARALAARTFAPLDLVARAVEESERVFHGTPSGVDAAAAQTGGVGRFDRQGGWQPLTLPAPLTLCVGLSGQIRATGDLVAAVVRVQTETPAARGLVDTLVAATTAGESALKIGDIRALGRLFNIAHGALAGLSASTRALDILVHTARAHGAWGAKLTGAGGGGAVIALPAEGRSGDIIAAWQAEGFSGFVTEIGSGG